MRTVGTFLRQILVHRSAICLLAAHEIHTRFVGTFAGFTWSVVNPLMMVLVYWFVFSIGFKIQSVDNVPFVLVYICGMTPFLLFSEALSNSAETVVKNAHLVKKTHFPTEILPPVQVLSGLLGHGILLLMLAALMPLNGVGFSLYNVQSLYYLFSLVVLCLGLSWLLAAANVYCRDLGHILKVVLNVWFWATPIVWPMEIMPERFRPFLKLNPLCYIVDGYRGSLLYRTPMWHDSQLTLYFWAVNLALLAAGVVVFRRLKPGFGDVL
jgi:lipopolysaccharide transport system permease protein/teichoic acid transport system permease protein